MTVKTSAKIADKCKSTSSEVKSSGEDYKQKPTKKIEEEIINSRKAIWLRSKNEIKEASDLFLKYSSTLPLK